ncbi:hypothetical protein GNZ01_06445 [Escherichia coli]|uniref:Uncharacterized protein n=3 Tax=root TaxID=1 RepID=A0AAJ3CV48_ECOLX|nr:hypothetical protein [Escherichia coli]YP_009150328.1 virion structural protein [Escherichia phage PBECO4]AXC36814.1 hypothetical protein [Escherichia phage UB]MED6573284.1 hypothetical protein [Escherichia coli O157]WPK18195.1 hypothetical protein [Salmonella phage SD-2_S15]WPK20540.1 hypothetical protein [Salmonella phage SD-15_S21]AGC34694.1 hypothetical protein [Escherichia phage PBECO4]
MDNFFSTETTTVPNGYVYTSHTGAKYVFLEGFWFNDNNMLMVDPRKYPSMYASARQQIVEHNLASNEYKIGNKYIVEGKECTFIGENRFNSKDGILLTESEFITELMADDHRVYNVSKETLQKEWNALKFYILPPYADDISIPAGMEVSGFKFVPKNHRFVDMKSGRAVDPAMTRKLSDEGMRIARQLASKNKLIPIKSTLVQGNTRCEWNGKEFCDNDGNVVIPEQNAHAIINAYQQFVKNNPSDFPTLTGEQEHSEQRFGSGEKPQQASQPAKQPVFATKESINEADEEIEEFESITVPDGYRMTSSKGKTYAKKNNLWYDIESKKQLNTSASKSVERAAQRDIFRHNNSGAMKIGTKVKSKQGKEYSYVGGDRFISADGKFIPKATAAKLLAKYEQDKEVKSDETPEVDSGTEQIQSKEEPKKEPESEQKPDEVSEPETKSETIAGDDVQSLASKIKESPYAKKITVLLTRGDEVSLLAADILLSGKKDETVQILKSLNNND